MKRAWASVVLVLGTLCSSAFGRASSAGGSEAVSDDLIAMVPDYTDALVRTSITLVVMIVSLLILARVLPRFIRRFNQDTPGARLKRVESVQLMPGQMLHLVRCDSKRYLVGTSAAGVSLIAEIPADGESMTSDFGARLRSDRSAAASAVPPIPPRSPTFERADDAPLDAVRR